MVDACAVFGAHYLSGPLHCVAYLKYAVPEFVPLVVRNAEPASNLPGGAGAGLPGSVAESSMKRHVVYFTDGRDQPTISRLGFHQILSRLMGDLTSPCQIEEFSCH